MLMLNPRGTTCLVALALVACGGAPPPEPDVAADESATNETATADTAANDTAAGQGPTGRAVASVTASRRELCVRFLDGQLACARVLAGQTLELTRTEVALPTGGAVGLGFESCIADGARVTCGDLDDAARPTQELSFPFEPLELVIVPGRGRPAPDGRNLLGPSEVCGRGRRGEVRCAELGRRASAGQQRVLFERSTALVAQGAVLYSLRDDGVLECVGDGSCAAMAFATRNARRGGGGGRVGGLTTAPAPAPTPPTLAESHRNLADAWPNALESVATHERPTALATPPVAELLSADPCLRLRGGEVMCWERHRPPFVLDGLRGAENHARWGLLHCARRGARVTCVPEPPRHDAGRQPTEPREGLEFEVPGAEAMVRLGATLCFVDGNHDLECRRRDRDGAVERVTLSLVR